MYEGQAAGQAAGSSAGPAELSQPRDQYRPPEQEMKSKQNPKLDTAINRANDAVERLNNIRLTLTDKNDKLFGAAPSVAINTGEDAEAGYINSLGSIIESVHEMASAIEREVSRLDELA